MAFNVRHHIKRAKEHLESGEDYRIFYACLDMRYALEEIAYQKLRTRIKYISDKELKGWQLSRVMNMLENLLDKHIGRDGTFSIAEQKDPNVLPETGWKHLGDNKGVSPKYISKHWHTIGSFLHIKKPTRNEVRTYHNVIEIREKLDEIIKYVENITSTGFDGYMCNTITIECNLCEQRIIRNADLLEEENIVQCQKPDCVASYIVTRQEDGSFEHKLNTITTICKCGKKVSYDANVLLDMDKTQQNLYKCEKCGTKIISMWKLYYSYEGEGEGEGGGS